MLKFVYITFLFIASSLLFVFSKERKPEEVCSIESRGLVVEDTENQRLIIVTPDSLTLIPCAINSDVILMPEKQVAVCYIIDSSRSVLAEGTRAIKIERLSYIK